MEDKAMPDLYRGNAASKACGLLAFVFLLLAIGLLLAGQWGLFGLAIGGSLVCGYMGYKLSGGRRNPGLIEQMALDFEGDVMRIPGIFWDDKVDLMLHKLLEQTSGDFALALSRLEIKNAPAPVASALMLARQSPDRANWNKLCAELKSHPPKGARRPK